MRNLYASINKDLGLHSQISLQSHIWSWPNNWIFVFWEENIESPSYLSDFWHAIPQTSKQNSLCIEARNNSAPSRLWISFYRWNFLPTLKINTGKGLPLKATAESGCQFGSMTGYGPVVWGVPSHQTPSVLWRLEQELYGCGVVVLLLFLPPRSKAF